MSKLSTKTHFLAIQNLVDEIDSNIYSEIHQMRSNFPLPKEERQVILNICRDILENRFDPLKAYSLSPKQPAIVLVSIYRKNTILGCAFEPEKTFLGSLVLSTLKAIELAKHKHLFCLNKVHFRINILFNKKTIDNSKIESIKNNFALGVDSISMHVQNRSSILKNSVPVFYGYSYETMLSKLARKCGSHYSAVCSDKTILEKYTTIEFREDDFNSINKHGLYDLYRGRQILLQSEITIENLKSTLSLAYASLKKFLFSTEEIAYTYTTNKKKWHYSNEHHANLRKIASLWVFIEVAHFLNDTSGIKMANNFLAVLLNNHYYSDNDMGFLEINGLVDIGTSGFLLLALNAINHDRKEILQLSKFILSTYDKQNQKLITIIKPAINYDSSPHESEYYLPGIGLKALSEIKDAPFATDANKIALQTLPYYRKLFDQSKDGSKMTTWLTAAYTNVFLNNPDMSLALFIYEINDILLKSQIKSTAKEIDLIGCFSNIGNVMVTAAITESLINAYKVADETHDTMRKKSYSKAILMSARFIVQTQIRPDETDDINSIGGFKNNFFDNNIRIDTMQHCTYAILNILKLYS